MRNLTKKSKKVLVGAAIVGLASSAVAYSYWTTSGGGVGSATTGTSTAVTLLQVGTISAMTPGSAAQAVDFSINNPAATNQFISSVAVAITGVNAPNSDGTHPCDATDYALLQPTATYGDLTPGLHTYSGITASGSTLRLVNTLANQDGCKGATLTLSFTAS